MALGIVPLGPLGVAIGLGTGIDVGSRAGAAAPQQETSRSATAPREVRSGAVDADVRWLADVLFTGGAVPAVRVGAAERLLALRDSAGAPREDAVAALSAGLMGPDSATAATVLDAMRQVDEAPAALASPLVEFTRTAPPELTERIRAAAARLSDDAIPTLTSIVLDDRADLASRRAAIVVLGAMRRQQSLAALVELLAPDARTRRDLKTLICEMLERSFGQDFGDDPDRWIRWWVDSRFEAQSPAVQSLVQQLRERVLALEAQSTRFRRDADEIAARLAGAYAEIFIALAPDLRMERVAKLMSDPLAAVREQCIGQVERMLANGESLSRPLTVAITERLSDPVPAHRIRAIKLVEGISRVESAPELAAAFRNETDPEVIAAYLRHFQRIPNPAVAQQLVTLLEDPRFNVEAARSLVRLAEDRALDESTALAARDTARVLAARAGRAGSGAASGVGTVGGSGNAANGTLVNGTLNGTGSSSAGQVGGGADPNGSGGGGGVSGAGGAGTSGPSGTSVPTASPTASSDVWFVRLLGVVGDEDDVAGIERLLTSADPALRGAAAEAMRHRRRLEPLVPLAADAAIYPVLVRGLADAPVDLERLRRVLALAPPSAAQVADRDAAVRRILATIDPAVLLDADDLLLAAGESLATVRREGLLRATELPLDAVGVDARDRLLMRLARILCFSGEPARAAAILEPLIRPEDTELEQLRFAAAVLDGRFDTAQQLVEAPDQWLDLLEEVNAKAPASAERVREAIHTRLVPTMSADQRARFDALSNRLAREGGAVPAPAGPPPESPPSDSPRRDVPPGTDPGSRMSQPVGANL